MKINIFFYRITWLSGQIVNVNEMSWLCYENSGTICLIGQGEGVGVTVVVIFPLFRQGPGVR